ncbi:MAG TPA: FtsX-like permease family protein, partial [Bryobacteraceae bacterium]|nr:FtsX-like permease family protein [Bryobacteraceae bacterium]
NVGSLLLARGVARQREISIRAAVGAGRARLIRQMLTESLVLAVIGATAAVLFAHLVLHELMTRTGAPSWLDVSPDSRVLLFSVGAACLAATLFGTMPALQMIRSFRGASAARHVLIGAQVSASCVLLIVAGLLVRAIDRAVSGDPGFEYKQVISVDPRLGVHGFSSLEARGYVDRLKNKLRSVPGVQAVALSTTPPLGNRVTTVGGEKDGKRFPIHLNRIDPEFFSTMKISLQRGRYLRQGEAGSIVVSESLARRLWPGEDPLAQHFSIGDQRHTVVGVAANAHANALSDPEAVEAYQLAPDDDMPNTTILVRVAASADTTAHTIAAAARATDPRVAPLVQTLRSAFARKVETTGQSAAAVGVLGGIAVLLACVGIAGAVAYVVSQRQKEIGIRMAIGAKPSDVVRAVVGQFWTPIGAGLLLGVAAAAALSQLLRAQLYGVSPLDPIAYAAATLLLGGTAAAAALLTGRRALRVNPVKALRCE